jgi:tRNA A-37 threonylcarbamoyl transferase component Bud32
MLSSLPVIAGDIRWHVAPEHRDLLLGSHGLRLEEWRERGQVRVVKQGPHRVVYEVLAGGLSFFVKHNRLPNLRAWLRQLVRPSKARREYEHALVIAARGIPTFVPLAVGEQQGLRPRASFLITRSLENTEPVGTFIETTLAQAPPRRATLLRQRLATELGKLVALMHRAGVAHQDFHAGNVLVQLQAEDRLSLYLIDLHALRVGDALSWRAIRANLVMLNRWFILRASRTDRLRFWRAYWSALNEDRAGQPRPELPRNLSPADLARALERQTWQSNLHFWRSRDRRCLFTNRYYRRVQSASAQGYAVTDLDLAEQNILLADPDEPFRRPGVRVLKDSPSSTVVEFDLPAGETTRRVVYKRFRVKNWMAPFLSLVRRSPALRSWVQGHGLRERFLPTARPLLVLHRLRRGMDQEGYLLTEKIDQALDLHTYLARLEALPADENRRQRRRLIEIVARLVRELHARKLSQRDLKANNLLVVAGAATGADPTCWLIDLVGMERCRKLRRARRVQNLARLHASFFGRSCLSRTDKVRFLRVYLAWGIRGREGWKRWWHDIAQATQVKVARNARQGRSLA